MKRKYKCTIITAVTALFLSASCQHETLQDFSSIVDAHARWQAYGLKNYSIEQRRICFCPPPHGFVRLTIQDNKIAAGIDLTTGQPVPLDRLQSYQTVEELFTWIATTQAMHPARLVLEYDTHFGYPKKIEFDYGENIANDELWIEVQALQKLSE
ncbi:MAG: hypothetical protein ILNGONEN_02061 [Syntrophorhabdaceae bacterium]|nr:hypothetical protein [Syntrophorhabdaceae bacterium]